MRTDLVESGKDLFDDLLAGGAEAATHAVQELLVVDGAITTSVKDSKELFSLLSVETNTEVMDGLFEFLNV